MTDATPIKILLADDDKDDCFLFKEALGEIPMATQFMAVHDGEQLMHYLNKEKDILPFVLFLDLNMPRKSGYECLKEIKSSDELKQLPVIIFSTSYDEAKANQLYEMGAHHYICKPADFSLLKKTIEHLLHLISKERASQPPKEKFLLQLLRTVLS